MWLREQPDINARLPSRACGSAVKNGIESARWLEWDSAGDGAEFDVRRDDFRARFSFRGGISCFTVEGSSILHGGASFGAISSYRRSK